MGVAPAGRRERLLVGLGCIAVTAGFLAMAAGHGVLGVPRNDDWTYYRVAFAMAERGAFDPDPYTQAMLLGQAVMAQPVIAAFGAEFAPLQVLVSLLGCAGLYTTYLVVRSFLRAGPSLIALGVLALGPLYGSTSTSFMTDVPAFALQAAALWAALKALSPVRVDTRWLAAAYGLSLVAFSIREYAVAAPVAITLTLMWTRTTTARDAVRRLALPVLWLVLAGALYAARSSFTGGGSLEPMDEILSVTTLRHAVRAAATLALLVLPVAIPAVAVLVSGPSRRRQRWAVVGLVLGIAVAAVMVRAEPAIQPIGNYLTLHGSYPETLAGPQVPLWADVVWYGLSVAMLVMTALLVWLTVRAAATRGLSLSRWRAAPSPVGAALSASFAISVLVVTVGVTTVTAGSPFDRYLMPAAPFLAASVLHAADRLTPGAGGVAAPWRIGTVIALALFAVVGLRTTDASATLDGAKWRLGEAVTAQGVEPETIDAGLEWFGMHQQAPIVVGPRRDGRFGFWVTRLFTTPRVCVAGVYEGGAPADSDVLTRVSAHGWLGTSYDLVSYRVAPGCATP